MIIALDATLLTIQCNKIYQRQTTKMVREIYLTDIKSLKFTLLLLQVTSYHSCKTNEPSIFFSMDSGGKFRGENMSLKLELGAGLNS